MVTSTITANEYDNEYHIDECIGPSIVGDTIKGEKSVIKIIILYLNKAVSMRISRHFIHQSEVESRATQKVCQYHDGPLHTPPPMRNRINTTVTQDCRKL